MDAFLILGQIPGTNYQITFDNIIAFIIVTVLIWLLYMEFQLLKAKLVTTSLKNSKPKFSDASYTESNG